jgi:hypothetical protein
MNHGSIKVPIVCIAALLVVACDQSSGYRGFGAFTDNGAATANERYVVDFGPVDLGKPGYKAFKMAGLPSVEFTMGLRPVGVSAGCDAAALNSVSVRLEVKTEDGAVVMAEEGPFKTWVTSSSLVYRRGAEHQEPKSGGAVERVRSDVHASQGWGTYFTPQGSATYRAKFNVLETNGASNCQSRLVLLSGGWK